MRFGSREPLLLFLGVELEPKLFMLMLCAP